MPDTTACSEGHLCCPVRVRAHDHGIRPEFCGPCQAPRTEARPGSEPDGPGFGRPWVATPGATFIADGAFVRSVVAATSPPRGLVAMDLPGRWNRAAKDTLSVIISPETAEELGAFLTEAAGAARRDEAVVKEREGGR